MTDCVEYRTLAESRPDLFPATPPGGIEIITDDHADSRFGVMYQDAYVLLLRDHVRFPDGRDGGYIRIVPASQAPGAAVLPLLDDQVVLIHQFRHAVRQWQWQIPRGFGDGADDSAEATAARELVEEIGCDEPHLTPLGSLHPDTGLLGARVHLFLGDITTIGTGERAEGITELRLVPATHLDGLVRNGELTDGFTLAAITAARARHLL